MYKSPKIFLVLFFIGFQIVAQNKENRWAVGASVGVAKFASEDASFVGEQFNFQIPKLNATRYFFNGLSLDASVAVSVLKSFSGVFDNAITYLSLDTSIKYDFGTSNENFVPYFLFGASFINTSNTMTPTLNVGGGGTFWLNSKYGINVQLLYKAVSDTNLTLRSHTYFSVGAVYSFKPRTQVPRLWSNNNY
jgi:hypothetical protein